MATPPVSSKSSQTLVHDEVEPESFHCESAVVDHTSRNEDKQTAAIEVFVEESEGEESESDDEHEYYEEKHGDHSDMVVYWSPWKKWLHIGRGWPHDFMRSRDLSKPNDELLKDAMNQRWLRKISEVDQKDLASLKIWTKGTPKIPLFKDELTGDEYQIYLHVGSHSGLASINCPTNLVPSPETPNRLPPSADPLYQVRYRLPPGDDSRRRPIPYPKFIIPLGKLAVRTSLREPWQTLCSRDEAPPTELTDYLVVVDAEHKDLPVWILVSQSVLSDRMDFKGKDYPQLPVFRGAMGNDEYGFDTACVFRSIHDLAQTDFEQACELVRNTRSVMDPRAIRVEAAKMAELSGTELPKDWPWASPDEAI